jgi:hypothetical protein
MKTTNEKTTIYLDPKIKKSVQYYVLRDRRSLSDIINQRLEEFLEDMADGEQDATFVSLEEVLSEHAIYEKDLPRTLRKAS